MPKLYGECNFCDFSFSLLTHQAQIQVALCFWSPCSIHPDDKEEQVAFRQCMLQIHFSCTLLCCVLVGCAGKTQWGGVCCVLVLEKFWRGAESDALDGQPLRGHFCIPLGINNLTVWVAMLACSLKLQMTLARISHSFENRNYI